MDGIAVKLGDGGETSNRVKVTKQNQLVVGSLEFSVPVQQDLNIIDTAFNFFEPQTGKTLIITDIVINATKSISVNGSTVEIFEANAADSTTATVDTFKFDIARQQVIVMTGLNLMGTEGRFLNAKCDSVTVLVTIAGYFAPS